MSWSFNPPPGWPLPSDWTPAPEWEPDPDWPPAPPGWEFWIHHPEPLPETTPEHRTGPYPEGSTGPYPQRPTGPYPQRRTERGRGRLWVGTAVVAVVLLACTGGAISFTWDRTPPREPRPPIPAAELPGWDDCDLQPITCNSGAAVPGGALAWGAPDHVLDWNLFATTDTTLAQILSGVLPTTGRYLPDGTWQWNLDLLAGEPIQVTANPDTYQYRIRPDAEWSDGTEITADDFIFAWKHNSLDDDLCAGCPSVRPGYDHIDTVRGSDLGKTVMVTFRERYPEWFTLFAGLYPAHIAERSGFDLDTPEGMKAASTWFGSTPPSWSGGPWRLTGLDSRTLATLEPNDGWYGPHRPLLDRIVFRFFPGPEAMRVALVSGEIDGFGPLRDPVPGYAAISEPGLLDELRPGMVWDHVDFNLDRKWTGKVALRRAVFTAIDIEEILAVAYLVPGAGTGSRGNHLFPPGSPHYEDHLSAAGQGAGDIAAARAILDDAGYDLADGTLTRRGERVGPLVLAYLAGSPRRERTAEHVAAQLARIGIDVETRPGSYGTFRKRNYDLVLFGWMAGPEFSDDGYAYWHSDSKSNFGGYANDDVDALVEQARHAYDQDLAAQLLNEAMRYLVDDAYVLPITTIPEQLAVRDEFRNLRPNPNSAAGPFYNSHEWGLALD